jgi:tetratricopeptide (TPR) repeat protein
MKAEALKIRIFLLLVAAAATAWAQPRSPISSSAPRSTVGTGTMPVTAYQSGLVTSPNPIDRTSDMVVTGNVGGGRQFHGSLPYNAISDFGGTLGSGTLDNFLRWSTIPQDYYSGGVAPFYSQTGTVTYIVPGTNMVVTPPSSKIRVEGHEEPINYTASSYYNRQEENVAVRSGELGHPELMMPPTSVEEMEKYAPTQPLTQVEMERIQQRLREEQKEAEKRLGQPVEQTEEPNQLVIEQKQTLQPSIKGEGERPYSRVPQQTAKLASPQEQVTKGQQPPQEDVYEQMLAEYEKAKQQLEEQVSQEQSQAEPNKPGKEAEKTKPQYQQVPTVRARPEKKVQPPAEKKPLSDIEVLARSRRAQAELQTFAGYSQNKFNGYMRVAEKFMQQGKYYLAADAYSMATVYKPLDPLGYAGRSHALFAAGEYVSSALYLSRAIELFPGYVDFKVDVAGMVGGMDTVERRIADIKACIELNPRPELYFLLAYVYMQVDRLDQAAEAIDVAYQRMPESRAVGLLRAAIEGRRNK